MSNLINSLDVNLPAAEQHRASPHTLEPGGLTPDQALQLSPVSLAYIGDAVYELYVRLTLLSPPKHIQRYHRQVVCHVSASGQVQQLACIEPYLSEQELAVCRKGRNGAIGVQRKANPQEYRQATGLEALIGYLYLTNPDRLMELWQYFNFAAQNAPE